MAEGFLKKYKKEWDIENPSFVDGSYEFKLKKFRETRDKIKNHILGFLKKVRD